MVLKVGFWASHHGVRASAKARTGVVDRQITVAKKPFRKVCITLSRNPIFIINLHVCLDVTTAEMARAERAAKKRAALQRYTTYEAPTADAMGAAIAAGMKAAVTAKRKRAALEHSADAAFLPVSVDGGASGMRWSARSWLQPLGDGESDVRGIVCT